MPTLAKTDSKQQARRMAILTRRGDTWWVSGSTCDTYVVTLVTDEQTGEVRLTCTCRDYTEYRAQRGDTCKHGDLVTARDMGESFDKNTVKHRTEPEPQKGTKETNNQNAFVLITTRYVGHRFCSSCGGSPVVGQPILYRRADGKMHHAACPIESMK